MNPSQQAEWIANNYNADQLDLALRTLIAERTLVEGAAGQVDKEAEQVLRDAWHMRLVMERVESVLPEREKDDLYDPRG